MRNQILVGRGAQREGGSKRARQLMRGLLCSLALLAAPAANRCEPAPSCKSNGDCKSDAFCKFPEGACNTEGTCQSRPQACTFIYKPVCGCDGKTYGNECAAAGAGVSVAHTGECDAKPAFCGGFAGIPCKVGICIDDPSDDCDPNQGGADCGGICVCKGPLPCPSNSHWDGSASVCACVPDPCPTNPCAAVLCQVGTQCVANGCQASCEPIGPVKCGNTECPTGQYCCNASCNMCAPPGVGCIQVACNQE